MMDELLDKLVLYDLLQRFVSGDLEAKRFCDLFTVAYSQRVDYGTLSDEEHEAFRVLCFYTSRFSPYLEDLAQYPEVYFDASQVREKATETYEQLKRN